MASYYPTLDRQRDDDPGLTPISPIYDNPPRLPTKSAQRQTTDYYNLSIQVPDPTMPIPELPEQSYQYNRQPAELPSPSPSPVSSIKKPKLLVPEKTVHFALGPDENPLSSHSLASPKLSGNGFDIHQPGQACHASQEIRGGTWKYGLTDCGEMGTCCTGMFCPCVLYGRTQYRLSQKSEGKDPTNMLGQPSLNGSCFAFAILCGCNLLLAAIQHTRVRKAYGITGGVGTDFVRACCCCCCTLAQDEKEAKYRETRARDLSNMTLQYSSPPAMNFAPSRI